MEKGNVEIKKTDNEADEKITGLEIQLILDSLQNKKNDSN